MIKHSTFSISVRCVTLTYFFGIDSHNASNEKSKHFIIQLMRMATFLPQFDLIIDRFNSFASTWGVELNPCLNFVTKMHSVGKSWSSIQYISHNFSHSYLERRVTIAYFFSSPENHFGKVAPLQCNFFTLTNIMHIGLFYFNAYFLYARFLSYHRWAKVK